MLGFESSLELSPSDRDGVEGIAGQLRRQLNPQSLNVGTPIIEVLLDSVAIFMEFSPIVDDPTHGFQIAYQRVVRRLSVYGCKRESSDQRQKRVTSFTGGGLEVGGQLPSIGLVSLGPLVQRLQAFLTQRVVSRRQRAFDFCIEVSVRFNPQTLKLPGQRHWQLPRRMSGDELAGREQA